MEGAPLREKDLNALSVGVAALILLAHLIENILPGAGHQPVAFGNPLGLYDIANLDQTDEDDTLLSNLHQLIVHVFGNGLKAGAADQHLLKTGHFFKDLIKRHLSHLLQLLLNTLNNLSIRILMP